MFNFTAPFFLLLTLPTVQVVVAIGPAPVLLWPDGAPEAVGSDESDQPSLRVYLPKTEQATRAGVVICPGGGYRVLATDHEGHQVAKWFNRKGIAAFVLRYRHAPKYRHPVPLLDVQRAVRLVRSHAEEYDIDVKRLGVMGFSAGGHLASTLATHFDLGDPQATDPIDRQSCRPDFAVLCYPVINLTESYAHHGSARNLLGPEASLDLLKSLSNDTQVTSETSPTFLFHTAEDSTVPVQNSLDFFMALQKAGVPSELHVYQAGPHGVGLSPADPAIFGWKNRLFDWMHASGFLTSAKRVAVQGTVSIDSKPLRWGMVAFIPADKSQPRAWGIVNHGKFDLHGLRGAVLGKNRVEIYDFGQVEPYPTQEDLLLYNSKQIVEVVEGDNVFKINLPCSRKETVIVKTSTEPTH